MVLFRLLYLFPSPWRWTSNNHRTSMLWHWCWTQFDAISVLLLLTNLLFGFHSFLTFKRFANREDDTVVDQGRLLQINLNSTGKTDLCYSGLLRTGLAMQPGCLWIVSPLALTSWALRFRCAGWSSRPIKFFLMWLDAVLRLCFRTHAIIYTRTGLGIHMVWLGMSRLKD